MTDGVVVVDKPAGITSHDVVDKVRKVFETKRVGHGGTLDPDATGVLLLGVGRVTRVLSYAQAGPKSYRAQGKLGVTTSTYDATGDEVEVRPVESGSDELAAAVASFVGEIDQVPPMVSAVKIGGERLYKKARRGEDVERPARRVTIYSADLVSFDSPLFELDVRCSGGTYIRSLIADIGTNLGCGAHMTRLRRTEAGGFTEADAVPLDKLTPNDLRPATDAVRELPFLKVDAAEAELVSHGRRLARPEGIEGGSVAVVSDGDLLAVYRVDEGELIPERVLKTGDGS